VRMANIAQVVNVLAPILTTAEGIVRQTIFHPLRLFSRHMRGDSVDVHVECDAHELHGETSPWPHRVADMGPFKVLDVTSVRDRSGVVNLAVVNRELERDVHARIEVPGASGGSALELNAPSVETTNSFDCPAAVNVIERSLPEIGPIFAYTFPAHSLTLLRLVQETTG